jgi:hypothetical protein
MPASATTATAMGTFEVSSMEEDTYQQLDGAEKLTRARGTQRFSGDLTGDGSVEAPGGPKGSFTLEYSLD